MPDPVFLLVPNCFNYCPCFFHHCQYFFIGFVICTFYLLHSPPYFKCLLPIVRTFCKLSVSAPCSATDHTIVVTILFFTALVRRSLRCVNASFAIPIPVWISVSHFAVINQPR